MKKLKVIFCGTPDFSVPTLDMLCNHPSIEVVGVVTMPDRPVGRGLELKSPPVAEFAKAQKLPLFQAENINKDETFFKKFCDDRPDFILVLAFAQFLGSKMLGLPKLGCFNIHTSILPKYRGAAPIQYALLNGDLSTGVSIQKMVKQMDAGDLCHFFEMPISPNENGGQLFTRLKFQAALSTNILIQEIIDGSIHFTPQDESKATFAPTLKKEDGHLHFLNQTAQEIFNRVRALDPWPGTYCFLGKARLKILSVEFSSHKVSPGKTAIHFGELIVGCREGSLHITRLQLEGKKACSDKEFLNGFKGKENELEFQ